MKSLADFPLIDCLQLIRSENVGPVSFAQLVQRYGSPAEALNALPELAKKGGLKRPFITASRVKIEKEITLTEKFGARFLRYGEADYPDYLQHIHAAPPVLVVKGHTHLWKLPRQCVGMVGSRNASAVGCQFTRKLARECAERGVTVVSGLARGIDANAHQGALAGGTVGVIAGGIDTLYPPENKMLYEAMAESGAILCEQAFGSTPQAKNFPARNRIIAGICQALLVVEAAPRSGSLITARYALEQDRELLAVPGSPMDPRSAGANGLIRDGATLVESVEDIMHALQRPFALQEKAQSNFGFMQEEPLAEGKDSKREQLLALLSSVAVEVDELTRQLDVPAQYVQQWLLELELAGRLVRSAGGKVSLSAEERPDTASLF